MEPLYQLWQNRADYEVYAVRLEVPPGRKQYRPVGVAGPLDSSVRAASIAELSALSYAFGAPMLALVERREEFTIHIPRA